MEPLTTFALILAAVGLARYWGYRRAVMDLLHRPGERGQTALAPPPALPTPRPPDTPPARLPPIPRKRRRSTKGPAE